MREGIASQRRVTGVTVWTRSDRRFVCPVCPSSSTPVKRCVTGRDVTRQGNSLHHRSSRPCRLAPQSVPRLRLRLSSVLQKEERRVPVQSDLGGRSKVIARF